MSAPKDGGRAFPCEQHETQDGSWNQSFEGGMSLRDWYAGKALTLIGARSWDHVPKNDLMETWAKASYALADAMLAERSKEPSA